MNIVDIAKAVAPNAEHEIIGIRPGEKLHEQMISPEDSYHTYEHPEYFKIWPAIHQWSSDPLRIKNGVKVVEGFSYDSLSNQQKMSVLELQGWIESHRAKIGAI